MADTTKASLGRPRFKLHSFSKIGHYARHPAEWDEECKRNRADMDESPEDEAVKELTMRCVEGAPAHR